jgi:hypothetical protein
MIEIPWLRSDVAANIRNNFAFYFGYERFGLYAACVAAVIVLNCMAVKFFFAGEYRFSAGDRRFFFNRKDKSELAGAAALAFSFLLYALNLFSLELSVFGNYDQMGSTTFSTCGAGCSRFLLPCALIRQQESITTLFTALRIIMR